MPKTDDVHSQYKAAVEAAISQITPLDEEAMARAHERQESLAKPPGSLGKLEEISERIAGMTGRLDTRIEKKRLLVFCADNGVWDEGVSVTPQSVTLAQTINLTRGLTGAGTLAKYFGDQLFVYDVGVKVDVHCPEVINRKVAYGTKNFYREDGSMTREQAWQAIAAGIEAADAAAADGMDILGVGEMGVGNTTTSVAILAAFTGLDSDDLVGRGGGLNDESFEKKKRVIKESLARLAPNPDDPIDVLSKVGGFDIAAMAGAFLGAAAHHIPIVIDGIISIVSALVAARICPAATGYMFASHASFEKSYSTAAKELGLEPFLLMGMRLGEGSGCPLAFEIIAAACYVLTDMATFEEAAINDDYLDEIRDESTDSFSA